MSGRHSKEDTTQPAEVSTASNVSVVQDPNDSGKVIIRTRKRKRIGKKKTSRWHRMPLALRVLIVVLLVAVALAGAAGITLAVAVNRGNVNLHRVFEEQDDSMGKAGASTSEKGQIVEYKGHTYRYNENIVAIALIGHDDESSFASRSAASGSPLLIPTCRSSRPSILFTAERVSSVIRFQSFASTASFGTIQLPPQHMIFGKDR